MGLSCCLVLVLRKVSENLKLKFAKRKTYKPNIEGTQSPSTSLFNTKIINQEIFDYKTAFIYFTGIILISIHVVIFHINHEYFSSEFHYFMNDQFIHFIGAIYIPFVIYCKNESMRKFVKDIFHTC